MITLQFCWIEHVALTFLLSIYCFCTFPTCTNKYPCWRAFSISFLFNFWSFFLCFWNI